jgi:hypothetical protein
MTWVKDRRIFRSKAEEALWVASIGAAEERAGFAEEKAREDLFAWDGLSFVQDGKLYFAFTEAEYVAAIRGAVEDAMTFDPDDSITA